MHIIFSTIVIVAGGYLACLVAEMSVVEVFFDRDFFFEKWVLGHVQIKYPVYRWVKICV